MKNTSSFEGMLGPAPAPTPALVLVLVLVVPYLPVIKNGFSFSFLITGIRRGEAVAVAVGGGAMVEDWSNWSWS